MAHSDFLDLIPLKAFPIPPARKPDIYTAATLDEAKLHEANLLNRILYHDLEARKMYANRAFWLVVAWLASVLVLLLLQGFFGHGKTEVSGKILGVSYTVNEPSLFVLPEAVLIAVISGTTVSVLGILAVVMNYLFPKRKI